MCPLLPKSLVLILSLAATAPALAVYKCEAGGKTLYSDQPCPNGRKLDAADQAGVAPADAEAARGRAAREKALAAGIDKERAKEDAARAKQEQLAARDARMKKSRCDALALRVKWAEEDAAGASAAAAARTRARRAAEQFDAQCRN